ncbi:ABC transporter substrate-binding protein [Endothiovibrio diazotrophicus]
MAPRAETLRLAVLYPDSAGPYREIFDTIIKGAEEEAGGHAERIPITDESDPQELSGTLTAKGINGVIALGPEGYHIAQAGTLPPGIATVSGAFFIPPNSVPGVSLAVDPEPLFRELKRLAPEVRRVHVVYDPKYNDWLIALARQAANRFGLRFDAYPVESLRDAVSRYRALIDQPLDEQDAVWLPVDATTVYDKVVLPLVLQAAWNQRFTVFSSKPSHAQKGALFSLFPDHDALGKRLAQMVKRLRRTNGGVTMEPLSDVKLAVNIRTANHLGLHFSNSLRHEFALVFPTR